MTRVSLRCGWPGGWCAWSWHWCGAGGGRGRGRVGGRRRCWAAAVLVWGWAGGRPWNAASTTTRPRRRGGRGAGGAGRVDQGGEHVAFARALVAVSAATWRTARTRPTNHEDAMTREGWR